MIHQYQNQFLLYKKIQEANNIKQKILETEIMYTQDRITNEIDAFLTDGNFKKSAEMLISLLRRNKKNRYCFLKYKQYKDQLKDFFLKRILFPNKSDCEDFKNKIGTFIKIFHYDTEEKFLNHKPLFLNLKGLKIEDILDIYNIDKRNIGVCFNTLLHRQPSRKTIIHNEENIIFILEKFIECEEFNNSYIEDELKSLILRLLRPETSKKLANILKLYDSRILLENFDFYFLVDPEGAINNLQSSAPNYGKLRINMSKKTIMKVVKDRNNIDLLRKIMLLGPYNESIVDYFSDEITIKERLEMIIKKRNKMYCYYDKLHDCLSLVRSDTREYLDLFEIFKEYGPIVCVDVVCGLLDQKLKRELKLNFLEAFIAFLKNNREFLVNKPEVFFILQPYLLYLNEESINFLMECAGFLRLTLSQPDNKSIHKFLIKCDYVKNVLLKL